MDPLVSIVTPAFQARRFIEETIESVLGQDYPHIEYVVMDGGSSDGTRELLARYGKRLQYVSEPDNGAADAINRGFERTRGAIFAWLNADDLYLPGAVSTAVRRLSEMPECAVVYGEGKWIDEYGGDLGRYPVRMPYRREDFERECGICQPAAFMRREAFQTVGMLRPELLFTFDYDLWIRLAREHQFAAVPDVLAASRMHRDNKTLGSRNGVFEENIGLLKQHYGYVPVNWVYGYLAYQRDGRDQFFEPLRHSAAMYLSSLPAGIRYNWHHPWRYLREWGSRLTLSALREMRQHAG